MAWFMHIWLGALRKREPEVFVRPRHCCLLLSFIVWCAHTATANWVTVTAGPCTYAVSPRSQSVGPAGGTVTIAVTSPVGCSWSASEQTTWISITAGATGTGSGTVTLTVAGNTSQSRSASVTVAGRTVTLSQRSSAPPRAPTGMRIVK